MYIAGVNGAVKMLLLQLLLLKMCLPSVPLFQGLTPPGENNFSGMTTYLVRRVKRARKTREAGVESL